MHNVTTTGKRLDDEQVGRALELWTTIPKALSEWRETTVRRALAGDESPSFMHPPLSFDVLHSVLIDAAEREGIDPTALILFRDNPTSLDTLKNAKAVIERLIRKMRHGADGTMDAPPDSVLAPQAPETPVYGPGVCGVLDSATRKALPAVVERPGYSYSRDTGGGIVSLKWGNRTYTFTLGQQAKAIAELVCAYERGRHSIPESVIGEKVGSDGSFRIGTLFRKGHSVWEILERVGAGTYRLKLPEQSA